MSSWGALMLWPQTLGSQTLLDPSVPCTASEAQQTDPSNGIASTGNQQRREGYATSEGERLSRCDLN